MFEQTFVVVYTIHDRQVIQQVRPPSIRSKADGDQNHEHLIIMGSPGVPYRLVQVEENIQSLKGLTAQS